jgi:hypothetical protein
MSNRGEKSSLIFKARQERVKLIGNIILGQVKVEMLLEASGRVRGEHSDLIDSYTKDGGERANSEFALF